MLNQYSGAISVSVFGMQETILSTEDEVDDDFDFPMHREKVSPLREKYPFSVATNSSAMRNKSSS